MKSAGVLTSKARAHHAFGASIAAMLLVVFASALAAAQSGAETAASETWKTAAASAAASAPTAGSGAGAPIAKAAAPLAARTAIAPSADSATAAGPSNMVATPPDLDNAQPGIAEIPPASSSNSADASQQQQQQQSSAADSQSSNESSEVARYQEEQSGLPPEQLRRLQQFDSEGELSTPFGMQLREARRTLKSGEEADGLLVTAVEKGSPAAAVGLRAYKHNVHDALTAAAMVGAVFSGGLAVVVIPALDYMQVGESYDLIIGVDGSRVTNFLDFQDRMRDLQPGEVIYLSVVRDGKRLQVTMPVPANVLQATN
jgi:hypothetical protein